MPLAFPKPTGNPQRQRRGMKLREYLKAKRDMARDPLHCRRCGTPHNIEAHHIAGRDWDKLAKPDDLIPLCHDCHGWVHAHPAESYELGLMRRRNHADR